MNSLPLLVTSEPRVSVVRALIKELELSAEQEEVALSLFHRALPPLATPHCLAYLLGISPKLIGAMAERNRRYYREFTIAKRSGEARIIVAPRRFLKLIQRWVLAHILAPQPISPYATGFRQGVSIFTNAAQHARRASLLCVDIDDFFPSITRPQVEGVFQNIGFPPPVSHQLSGLCTLGGVLPQGAPTSPALANLVFRDCDAALAQLANEWNASYTRYADDIVFSRSDRFAREHVDRLTAVIMDYGFQLNAKKTRRIGRGQRQIVTGLVVNDRPQPPRDTRRLWRAVFDRAERHPHEFRAKVEMLAGIRSFVHQYDAKLAQKYGHVIAGVQQSADGHRGLK